jgi:hypothetical protein
MTRARRENVGGKDAYKNGQGESILQKKERTTMKEMVGQCGDGDQRLLGKIRGQSRMEDGCERSQSPPEAVVVMMKMMMTRISKFCSWVHSYTEMSYGY